MVDAIPDTWPSRKYGIRLMPKLYEHLHPMPYEEAVRMAANLAADLRAEGYAGSNGIAERTQQYRGMKACWEARASA